METINNFIYYITINRLLQASNGNNMGEWLCKYH